MRFIPTRLHAPLDYIVGALLIAGPWIFQFSEHAAPTVISIVLGIGLIAYSLFTNYELGVWKVAPMAVHNLFDIVAGALPGRLAVALRLRRRVRERLGTLRRRRPCRDLPRPHDEAAGRLQLPKADGGHSLGSSPLQRAADLAAARTSSGCFRPLPHGAPALQDMAERDPALEPFDALIGTWDTEAKHRLVDAVVHGTVTFEWLEGGHFLLQRSRNDHELFPDAIWVIGAPEEGDGLVMEYFDSRGVRRTYRRLAR